MKCIFKAASQQGWFGKLVKCCGSNMLQQMGQKPSDIGNIRTGKRRILNHRQTIPRSTQRISRVLLFRPEPLEILYVSSRES